MVLPVQPEVISKSHYSGKINQIEKLGIPNPQIFKLEFRLLFNRDAKTLKIYDIANCTGIMYGSDLYEKLLQNAFRGFV